MSDVYTVKTLSPMRKIIGARMTEAKRTIPHFYLSADLEMDALIEVRHKLQEMDPSTKLSLNDLLIKACAAALMDAPDINIQFENGEIRQYRGADISVVTAIESGLSTPIIRGAQSKTVWEIARELKDLVSKASKNVLRMDQVFGGSFSISNLGMRGIDQFNAVINPPQCAILAVGRSAAQLLPSSSGTPRVAHVLRATLSLDHRALDGVAGAIFLTALRRRVEEPNFMLP